MNRLAGVLLALSFASPAAAWGPLGHLAVAQIAQERLSPAAQKKLEQLLGAPDALWRVAGCADIILHARGTVQCGGLINVPADDARVSAPWHYMNIPISARASAANISKHCQDGDKCVWGQVRRQAELLKSEPSPAKRKIALMFLVHFAGDLHQPLHVADHNDRGGNQAPVSIPGVSKNLHSTWDGLVMIREWQSPRPEPDTEDKTKVDLAELMAKLRAGISHADTGSWLQGDTVTAAALEGHAIPHDVIYPSYRETQGKLDGSYEDKMQPIAFERLERAGVRLAALLEEALGGGKDERLVDAKVASLSIQKALAESPVR